MTQSAIIMSPGFFILFATLAIVFSLAVILVRSAITSAFLLILDFFCFAAVFAIMGAHLVAGIQILVYAGAIMVLFLFVIMLLNVERAYFEVIRQRMSMKLMAAVVSAGLVFVFYWVFKNNSQWGLPGVFTPEKVAIAGGNTRVLSELMFSEYILPFELTSVLLLAAIVGSVAISKRHRSNKEGGRT